MLTLFGRVDAPLVLVSFMRFSSNKGFQNNGLQIVMHSIKIASTNDSNYNIFNYKNHKYFSRQFFIEIIIVILV